MRRSFLAWLMGMLALLAPVSGCATNPVTGQREFMLMSESQEVALGRESDGQVRAEMGIYDDPQLQQYVSDLGLRLAKQSERPHLPWQFAVVDQPAVNAFALPGGFIYVTRGILPYLADEAELVGVLGHEIGHVTARHSARQYSRSVGGLIGLGTLGVFVPAARPFGQISEQALGLLFLKYGRGDELQADRLGTRYAAAGGWDPEGVPGMLSTLGRLAEASGDRKGVPNWLSTHPAPLQRVTEIQPAVQQLKAGRSGFVTEREGLLRRLDGVVFGDNPNQGIARGSSFLHPSLRFRIDFPDRWEVANSPRQVVATSPNEDAFLVLQVLTKPTGRDVREVALSSMQSAGFGFIDGERTSVNGLDAFVGTYVGQIDGLGAVTSRAGHILHGGAYYLVAGLVPTDRLRGADGQFLSAIRSFRALTAAEADAIKPARLRLHDVTSGDTWASLAERSAGAITPASLAIMNHAAADSPPQPGRRIVIVQGD